MPPGFPERRELATHRSTIDLRFGHKTAGDGEGEVRVVRALPERMPLLVRCAPINQGTLADRPSSDAIRSRDQPSMGAPSASPTAQPISEAVT